MGTTAAKNCVDVGIVVGDIQKSLAIHVDVLGLKKLEEPPWWFGITHGLSFGDGFVNLIEPKQVPPPVRKGWSMPWVCVT